MKRLLLLLLLPLFSFSQTYDDIIGIDSEEMFIRTMIENGFERVESELEDFIVYAYNPSYEDDEAMSTIWVYHRVDDEDGVGIALFEVDTIRDFYASDDDISYDKMLDIVKEKCEYESLVDNPIVEGNQMVLYECEAKQRFSFDQKDGTGFIFYYYPLD